MSEIGSAIRPVEEYEQFIDRFARYQPKLDMYHLFPPIKNGLCNCGCGGKLTGRQSRWCNHSHRDACYLIWAIMKGQTKIIRPTLFQIDNGFCRGCGVECDWKEWHADHIKPVHLGGGGYGIENFQTLCIPCHKEKTKLEMSTPPIQNQLKLL